MSGGDHKDLLALRAEVKELRGENVALRAEMKEHREALLQLAHAHSQDRFFLLNIPRAERLAKKPEEIYAVISKTLVALNDMPLRTPEYEKAEWLTSLHRRAGMSFDAWRTLKYRPMVEASRKAR